MDQGVEDTEPDEANQISSRGGVTGAVASIIFGILSVVASLGGILTAWIAVPLGLVGILLGRSGKRRGAARLALGGIIVSIMGVMLSLILTASCIACVSSVDAEQLFHEVDRVRKQLKV